MRILVVGSLHNDCAAAQRGLFEEACREIGRACALAKIEIIIGSDSPNTADRFVVEGASSVDDHPIVWIIRPDYGSTPFDDEAFADRIRFRHESSGSRPTSTRRIVSRTSIVSQGVQCRFALLEGEKLSPLGTWDWSCVSNLFQESSPSIAHLSTSLSSLHN
jgi:hypothetical protein